MTWGSRTLRPMVDAMLEWCRQGPPGARVDDVVVSKMTAACKRVPFEIRP